MAYVGKSGRSSVLHLSELVDYLVYASYEVRESHHTLSHVVQRGIVVVHAPLVIALATVEHRQNSADGFQRASEVKQFLLLDMRTLQSQPAYSLAHVEEEGQREVVLLLKHQPELPHLLQPQVHLSGIA